MGSVVDAFAILDQQSLGRFVANAKFISNKIGHLTVLDQVEVVSLNVVIRQVPTTLEPAHSHGADGTAGAVLKD